MPTPPPRVFISYSHDSATHRALVLALANRLRQDGLDCALDQYVNGFPPEGWQRWMEDNLEAADFVLVVCTPLYLRRYRGQDRDGGRGVTFEGVVISQTLYDDFYQNTRFVPVLPEGGSLADVPLPLKAFGAYTLVAEYEKVYRILSGQAETPETPAPPMGQMVKLDEKHPIGFNPTLNLFTHHGLALDAQGLDFAGLSAQAVENIKQFKFGVSWQM